MSEQPLCKSNQSTNTPLPRFKPSKSTHNIKSSFSVPSNMSQLQKIESRRPPPPPRKPRAPNLLEFNNTASVPRQTIGEVYHPSSSKPVLLLSESDAIQGDDNMAVQLPMVPVQDQRAPLHEMLSSEKGDKLILVQLPSSLPVTYPNDSTQIDLNPLVNVADGQIGKLQIHKSGKVTAKFGNVTLDVSSSIAPSCLQLLCVKTEGGVEYCPISGNKLQFSVNVSRIIGDINKETD